MGFQYNGDRNVGMMHQSSGMRHATANPTCGSQSREMPIFRSLVQPMMFSPTTATMEPSSISSSASRLTPSERLDMVPDNLSGTPTPRGTTTKLPDDILARLGTTLELGVAVDKSVPWSHVSPATSQSSMSIHFLTSNQDGLVNDNAVNLDINQASDDLMPLVPAAAFMRTPVPEVRPDGATKAAKRKWSVDPNPSGYAFPRQNSLTRTQSTVLQEWLQRNMYKPCGLYPSPAEKKKLAEQCGSSLIQVRQWFLNARRRIRAAQEDCKKEHTVCGISSKSFKGMLPSTQDRQNERYSAPISVAACDGSPSDSSQAPTASSPYKGSESDSVDDSNS